MSRPGIQVDKIMENLGDGRISNKEKVKMIKDAQNIIPKMKVSNEQKSYLMEQLKSKIIELRFNNIMAKLDDDWVSGKDNAQIINKVLDEIFKMKISDDNKKIFMKEIEHRIVHLYCRKKLPYKEVKSIFSYLSHDCRNIINKLKS